MAGDWLKMEANTPEKSEVLAITSIMGWEDSDITVGKLFRMWRWFDQHTLNGNAPRVTSALLDKIIGVSGFCDAVREVGWLEITADGIYLPKFDRHNGATAKSRSLTAKRVAKHKGNAEGNAATVTTALPREEKRREELTTSNPNGLDAAIDADGLTADQSKPDCPHQKIIALYHEVLPMCPRIRDWTPARATQLRARWNEDEKRQNLEWWRKYFGYVRRCDFLVGRTAKPFFADLEWLVKSANFTKIREGKYENREVA